MAPSSPRALRWHKLSFCGHESNVAPSLIVRAKPMAPEIGGGHQLKDQGGWLPRIHRGPPLDPGALQLAPGPALRPSGAADRFQEYVDKASPDRGLKALNSSLSEGQGFQDMALRGVDRHRTGRHHPLRHAASAHGLCRTVQRALQRTATAHQGGQRARAAGPGGIGLLSLSSPQDQCSAAPNGLRPRCRKSPGKPREDSADAKTPFGARHAQRQGLHGHSQRTAGLHLGHRMGTSASRQHGRQGCLRRICSMTSKDTT